MRHLKKFIILFVFSILSISYGQGGASSCTQLAANFIDYQACATEITFENSVGNTSGEMFNMSCISSDLKAPTWFFIKMKEDGNIRLLINQESNNGAPLDVDFVLWGPFQDMEDICDKLIIQNEKDCSYLPDSEEIVDIPVSQAGDIYILLIDNYDNLPGQITISQIGGTGSTDCNFLATVKILDENAQEITNLNKCKPETQTLVANVDTSDYESDLSNLRFNYTWYLNNNEISSVSNSLQPTNSIVANQTGTYKVITTAYDITDLPEDMDNLKKYEAEINLTFSNNLILNAGPHNVTVCDYNKPYTDGLIIYDLQEVSKILTSSNAAIRWEFSLDTNFNTLIPNPRAYSNENAHNFSVYVRGYIENQTLNCYSNIVRVNISVNTIPGIDQILQPINICDDSGFGTFDLTVREPIILDAMPNQIKYYENLTDAIAGNNNNIKNPKSYKNIIKDSQIIYLQIPSNNLTNSITQTPCNKILEVEITVTPYPLNLLEINPYKICIDSSGKVINKALINTNLPHGEYEFIWYKNFDAQQGNQIAFGNTNIFETDVPGEYSVKIINIKNDALCTTIANFTVRNSLIPESVSVNPEYLIGFEQENTIQIIAQPASNDYQYMINNIGWQNDATFYNVHPGVYEVSVRNKFGCGVQTTSVVIADFPKFFTPNGDGINDTWNVYGQEIFEKATIRIFDRYGKLIKDVTANKKGWDGTYNGNPLPADDYWFTIDYSTKEIVGQYKGHFSLKR